MLNFHKTQPYSKSALLSCALFICVFSLGLFSLSGCNQDTDDVAGPRGGRCYIIRNLSTNILCIDFLDGSDANTNDGICSQARDQYQSSHAATGRDFTSGDGNNCDTTSVVGSCEVEYGAIRYFSGDFDASTAATDCTSAHGGTFTP